jgi:hypothetical protein
VEKTRKKKLWRLAGEDEAKELQQNLRHDQQKLGQEKRSSEAQIAELWYNEMGSLQTHQTNKRASMARQAMQKQN